MNKKQMLKHGITNEMANIGVDCIKKAAQAGFFNGKTVNSFIKKVIENPSEYANHEHFGDFAKSLIIEAEPEFVPSSPIDFPIWGEGIDSNAIEQMKVACQTPVAVAGAIMPDCHLGYGLPVGGVLATDNSVIPYAVGVDIACRMAFTIFDLPVKLIDTNLLKLQKAIEDGTNFGMGGEYRNKFSHRVMDQNWTVSPITKQMKDRAWAQLGTSGTGNHFVEFGIATLTKPELGLEPGEYLALMSHSGSRGTGAQVCKHYSEVAVQSIPKKYREYFKYLAWLDLDTEAGQEYWNAMNLMGDYASANHECIHNSITDSIGADVLAKIENHHNFAWKEIHGGKEVIVHRKGATPAGKGVLGVIPGSMADPAYIVRGKGSVSSLESASHGAGRRMSRRQGVKEMKWEYWRGVLAERGVKLISGGLDEVPGVYKDIRKVMSEQSDLVDIVAEFQPRIVKMADDGKAED
ncbi:RtcB family protein [Candidatus Parcubacteria bacterium]|nr:MAG: RtcB family protein [Candidatus Parcubacteria bacterium]